MDAIDTVWLEKKPNGEGRGEFAVGLGAIARGTEGGSVTILPDRECPTGFLAGASALIRLKDIVFWLSCGVDARTLRRSAMDGPNVVGGGAG